MSTINVFGRFATNDEELNNAIDYIKYLDSFRRADGSYKHMFKFTFKDGFQTPLFVDDFGASLEKDILLVNI